MSLLWMVKALSTKVKNASRKLVLVKLADNANDEGICWPSIPHIADQCEMSTRTVQRHLKDLQKAGFLKIEQRRRNNFVNQSNLYTLLFSEGEEFKPVEDDEPSVTSEATSDEGDNLTPYVEEGDTLSPPPVTESPPQGDTVSPRTCHFPEPVSEPSFSDGAREINSAGAAEDTRTKFTMGLDWQPGERFVSLCRTQGVDLSRFDQAGFVDQLGDFRSYWHTASDRALSQGQWEHKFAQQLKRALRNFGKESHHATGQSSGSAKSRSGAAILAEGCAGAFR